MLTIAMLTDVDRCSEVFVNIEAIAPPCFHSSAQCNFIAMILTDGADNDILGGDRADEGRTMLMMITRIVINKAYSGLLMVVTMRMLRFPIERRRGWLAR